MNLRAALQVCHLRCARVWQLQSTQARVCTRASLLQLQVKLQQRRRCTTTSGHILAAAAAAAAAVTARGTENHMHCVSDSTATLCEGHMGVNAHCTTCPVAVTALHMPPGMDKKNKALAQRPCTI